MPKDLKNEKLPYFLQHAENPVDRRKMKNRFSGVYLKHQKEDRVLALIPGRGLEGAFLQVVTPNRAYHVDGIGESLFTPRGISVFLDTPKLSLHGKLSYGAFTPLRYDIMGPFKYFPMECRHGVISMRHTLTGSMEINGEVLDFDGGTGYIETDRGTSFPRSYLWLQCSDFSVPLSVMASVAEIPFLGKYFLGAIAAIWYEGREYRLATYLGVRILRADETGLVLKQGKLKLMIEVEEGKGVGLLAPVFGEMRRTVHESLQRSARFRLYENETCIFDFESKNASFEFVK